MSRYQVTSGQHYIDVGWDNQMQSFFAIIQDPNVPEDKDPVIAWIGNGYGSINSVKRLQELVAAYGARIPRDIANKLKSDC